MKEQPQLLCLYTSGVKPFTNDHRLADHDDWGIKYYSSCSAYSLDKVNLICNHVVEEVQTLFPSENCYLFARWWEDSGKSFLIIVVGDREATSLRSNSLLVILERVGKLPVLEFLSCLECAGKRLPEGLTQLRKNPHLKLQCAEEKEISLEQIVIKKGFPNFSQVSPESQPMLKKFRKRAIVKPLIGAAVLFLLVSVIWKTMLNSENAGENHNWHVATMNQNLTQQAQQIHSLQATKTDLLTKISDLEEENLELHSKLREHDRLASQVGGWEELQQVVSKFQRWNLEVAEIEKKLKIAQQNQQRLLYLKDHLRKILHHLKKSRISYGETRRNEKGELVEVTVMQSSSLKEVERQIKKIIQEP